MQNPSALPLPHQNAVAAVGLMCTAMFVVPLTDVAAKVLGEDGISPFQTVFLRMAIGVLILLPIVHRYEPALLRRIDRPLPCLLLGASIVGAISCFFLALKYMQIADALAVSFVQPFFVAILSKILLKERVGKERVIALLIGFGATLIIIRPSSEAFNPASIFPLMSGAFMALYVMVLRRGMAQASGLAVVFYTHASSMLVTLPVLALVWQPLQGGQWLMIGFIALLGLAVQYMLIKAYQLGEASLVAPLSYTEMISSVMVGWWFFAELPDGLTLAGTAVLIGCALFISLQSRH